MEAEQRADGQGALPLTEICIRALTRYKRFLGDVGFVEAAHLSRVLAHCTRAELESIEDCTWEGSQRDLTWCTWHLWHRLYKDNYGQPDPEQLLPLPGEPPLDYAPPPGLDCTPADYRGMLQQREADIAARRAAAADRLRANYKAENSKRLAAGVEYTTKLPPPKRAKGSPAAALQRQRAAASPARNLGGKPAGKVMQELGLARPGRSGSSSRPGPAGQQRGKGHWPVSWVPPIAMAFNHLVTTLRSALRWEGQPVRPYVHPSQYRAPENVRLYSDGMHKLYEPSFLTLAISVVTLGLYVGVPHILLALLAFSWWRPAAITLGLLLVSLLLPAKPLRLPSVLSSYVFLCWRRYFKFSYLFEKSLDCYQDYVIAQFPHGAFPLGALLGGTFMATEYPGYTCYATAASSAFYVPIWRHVHAWLGTEVCTKTNFHHLLSLGVKGPLPQRHHHHNGPSEQQQQQQDEPQLSSSHSGKGAADALLPPPEAAGPAGAGWRLDPATGGRKTGVSVGLMVGGIAEMFMIRRDHERIKLKDRKGFVRVALEHGVPILPVYMFGANQVLDFGPPWLQRLSRRMRASVGMIYGLWGLPVPRRLPIFKVTGLPMDVGPAMRKDHPDFAARVDELHAQFIEEIQRVYYTHRGKYGHGFENRPLVIC
ncbi:hypothetical protein OEZ86_014733 [Tetradesmus obliquus]|nr:hypothetical protein OEZ86_014733 [Tetradesmus obliquus]